MESTMRTSSNLFNISSLAAYSLFLALTFRHTQIITIRYLKFNGQLQRSSSTFCTSSVFVTITCHHYASRRACFDAPHSTGFPAPPGLPWCRLRLPIGSGPLTWPMASL